MKLSQATILTTIALAIGLLAASIVTYHVIERWPEQRPSWARSQFAEAPEWFRALENIEAVPENRARIMAILDRGLREGVAVAGCMKATLIVVEHGRTGELNREEFAALPKLLESYRLDECPMAPIMLAVIYKYGLGVEPDPHMVTHHLRKIAMFVGYTKRTAAYMTRSVFQPNTDYDVAPELNLAGKWFLDEYASYPLETKLAVVERYLTGTSVPKDEDMGYRLLLSIDHEEHSPESAYRAARAVIDKRISYPMNWTHVAGSLLYSAAIDGHAGARREFGLELLAEAKADPEKLLHAYGFLLWAKDAGANNVDTVMSSIAERLDDAELDKKARELISALGLKRNFQFNR